MTVASRGHSSTPRQHINLVLFPPGSLSELYTLLLEDILVLLQKQDERLILKCHSKNLAGSADTKHIFSPIIKLNTVLVRSVATGQHR